MSIGMDLDNEDTSGLSGVESERPDPGPSTRRRSTRHKRPTNTNTRAADSNATKGNPRKRRAGGEESGDIAMPVLDEDGNLQEQSDDLVEESEESSESAEDDDADEQDSDFARPKGRSMGRNGRARGREGRGGAGGGRSAKGRTSAANRKGSTRRRKGNVEGEEDAIGGEGAITAADGTRGKDDFSVEADNNLFNAVKDPRAATAATVEDWLETYRADEDSRGQALADLVNFVLRCCGCNSSVDMHEAQDLDGVVSKLDDIQMEFAKVNQASYPLVSKSKGYRKFRSSLLEFMTKLVETTAISEVLYDDIFCETLQSWLVALSSSKLRAFRHTSTVISLHFVEALCEVSLSNKDDSAQLQRQKEAEMRRAGKLVVKSTRAGATDKTRLQELEALIKATHGKKLRHETYFKELFNAVFIHRYRDAEPTIRMECIRSLGVWMSTLPDHFLEGSYLRYIGWMLTDLDKTVRREAVASLSAVYDKDDYIMAMQHFTERFKGRLVEMATSDAELNIRVEAIQVLRQIDRHGLLEDDQRDQIARLIFDAEPRARRAAAAFFDSLLKERVDEKRTSLRAHRPAANEPEHSAEDLENMLQWKCLASMLVVFNSQLDIEIAQQLQSLAVTGLEDDLEDDGEESSNANSAVTRLSNSRDRTDARLRGGSGVASIAQLTAILQGQNKDRVSLAVETLYFEVEIARNWQSLLDFLLLDHSAVQSAAAGGDSVQSQVHSVCRLQDAEETVLLSVFAASVKTSRDRAKYLANTTDDEREEFYKTTTRAIMNTISRLFAKHQTEPTRCMALLLLPQQMNLDLYLEMRQVTNYEQLWDDITRQFVGHNDLYLLEKAMDAINALRSTQALSATNSEKASALEIAAVDTLRQLLDNIDAVNATPVDQDTVQKLTPWLARLSLILKNWDAVSSLTDAGPENLPTVVESLNQLVERGRMGFQEEEKVIQHSLDILYLCYLWQITKVPQGESTPEHLIEQRNALVQQCQDYAIGDLNSASIGVKRTAFRLLLDLHITAKARYSISEDATDAFTLSDQTQYRCAGFVQAEIERYAGFFNPKANALDDLIDENEDAEINEVAAENSDTASAFRPVTLAQHAATYAFNDLIVSYARAICVDVLDLHHASTVFVHYGRFGPFFNECCRWLGDAMRQFGILGEAGYAAADVAIESLKGAASLYIAATVKSDSCFLALARHLSNHLVVRSRGFTVAARLPSEDLVRLHKDLITFTIKKYKALTDQERHTSKNKALIMFKGLVQCLLGMTGKEAAVVYAHMNETLKEHGIEVPASSASWTGQLAYDRRLVTLMSRDAGIKVTARKTVRTRKERIGENASEAEGGEERNDGSQLPGRGRVRAKAAGNADSQIRSKRSKGAKKVHSKPQALPTRRSNRSNAQEGASMYIEDDSGEAEEDDISSSPSMPVQAKSARRAPTPSDDDDESESDGVYVVAGNTLPARRRGAIESGDYERRRPQSDDASLPDRDSSANPASSIRGVSPDLVMELSTQELAETASLALDVPDTPPGLDSQSDNGANLPRRKRSRF